MKATDIRKGQILKLPDGLFEVTEYTHVTPGKGRAHNQVKLKNLRTGAKAELRLSSGDTVESAYLDKRKCTLLYREPSGAGVFMDAETFDQFELPDALVGHQLGYIVENHEVVVVLCDGEPLKLVLPSAVVLTVMVTEGGTRGDTVGGVLQTVTCNTGMEVKAPLHIKEGESIKVSTETGEFLGRVSPER